MSHRLISGSSNLPLAQAVARAAKIDLDDTHRAHFPNSELNVRVNSAGSTSYLMQSFSQPVNSHIIEFLLLSDAAKRLGADTLIGIIPWFGYSKQDKVFLEGEPLSAKVIARVLQTVPLKKILTFDLHNPSISGYFDIPVNNLSARTLFLEHLSHLDLDDAIVVSPDAGAVKPATSFAHALKLPVSHINKVRDLNTGEVSVVDISHPVKNKHAIIFDDMIATGSTLIHTSEFLHHQGVGRITVCATHHLFINGVQAKLEASYIDQLIITDTIKPPGNRLKDTTILSVAPLLAQSIR